MRAILLTLLGATLLIPAAALGQSWQVEFDGGYIPTDPPGAGDDLQRGDDNPFDPTLQLNDGAELPVGSESYMNFVDTSTDSGQKWDEYNADHTSLNEAFPSGGTMVFRARRPTGAAGTGDATLFNIENNGNRFQVWLGYNGGLHYNDGSNGGSGTTVTVPGGLDAWNVYRINWAPGVGGLRIRTFINGDINYVDEHLATNGGTEQWKMGSSSGGTGEYELDWLLLTSDGAYSPGAGPVLPAGYNEGFTGPTPTPEPPTPTPTITPTPTPCGPENVCNGSFETGDLSFWEATDTGGTGDGATVTGSTFGNVVAYDGIYAWFSAANGGAKDAAIYQHVPVVPGGIYQAQAYTHNGGAGAADRPDNASRIGVSDGALTEPDVDTKWSNWNTAQLQWEQIVAPPLTASGATITVFLEIDQTPVEPGIDWNLNRIDAVELLKFSPASVEYWDRNR